MNPLETAIPRFKTKIEREGFRENRLHEYSDGGGSAR